MFDALREWVQPQHLVTSRVAGYRADFERHPAHVLRITDFLKPDKVARLVRFLDQEATYEQVYRLYGTDRRSKGDQVSVDGWRAADKDSRWYTFRRMTGYDPRFRLSPNLLTCLNFRTVLVTYPFSTYLRAVTGLPLVEDPLYRGFEQMRPGDFLGPHSDDTEGRRLTFVFYLSPAWKADYGGMLHIIGMNDEYFKIDSTFNSLVVFDVKTHKLHYVTAIRDAAGDQSRVTLGGWFRGPEHQ